MQEIWLLTIILGLIWCQIIAHFGSSILLHRYYSHKTIKKVPVWYEWLWGWIMTMVGSRSIIGWVSAHRMHHKFSDTEKDPHSPAIKGFWRIFFHIWHVPTIPKKYAQDLFKNPQLVFFHKNWVKVLLLTWLVSYSIDVLLGNAFTPYFFIGFVLMPVLFTQIGFGLLNSVGHGVTCFNKTSKGPQNIIWINFFIAGEGWHEVHHDEPWKARLHKYDTAGWLSEKFFQTT